PKRSRTARSWGRDVVVQHLRVACAVPQIHAELTAALLVDLPVPAESLVGGLTAAIVLGRGARLLRRQRRRWNDRRAWCFGAEGGAMHTRLGCGRGRTLERAAAVIDPAPVARGPLPHRREVAAGRAGGFEP